MLHFTHMKINEPNFLPDLVGNTVVWHISITNARIIRPISARYVVSSHFILSVQRVFACSFHQQQKQNKKHNPKRYNLFWQQVKNEIKPYNLFKLIFKSIFASFFLSPTPVRNGCFCARSAFDSIRVPFSHSIPVQSNISQRKKNLHHTETKKWSGRKPTWEKKKMRAHRMTRTIFCKSRAKNDEVND